MTTGLLNGKGSSKNKGDDSEYMTSVNDLDEDDQQPIDDELDIDANLMRLKTSELQIDPEDAHLHH